MFLLCAKIKIIKQRKYESTELNSKFIIDKISFGERTVNAHTATEGFSIPSKSGYSIALVIPTVNKSYYGYYSGIVNGNLVCFTNNHSAAHTNSFGAIVLYVKN